MPSNVCCCGRSSQAQFRKFHEKALGFKTWIIFLKSIDGVAIHRRSDLRIDVGLEAAPSE